MSYLEVSSFQQNDYASVSSRKDPEVKSEKTGALHDSESGSFKTEFESMLTLINENWEADHPTDPQKLHGKHPVQGKAEDRDTSGFLKPGIRSDWSA